MIKRTPVRSVLAVEELEARLALSVNTLAPTGSLPLFGTVQVADKAFIDISHYQLGVGPSSKPSGPSSAKPSITDLTVKGKPTNKAVPLGDKAGQEYLQLSFTDTMVAGYRAGGSGGDVIPSDQFKIDFGKIDFGPPPPSGNAPNCTPKSGT
jgi:hypothetical protein